MSLLPPEPGALHLWQASLAVDPPSLSRLRRSLSPEEECRGSRLIDPVVRGRFLAGRGLVREILSSYLGTDPKALRLEAAPQGKLFLAPHSSDLRFNVTHCADLLLLAVTTGVEVGVDLELVREELDFPPLARTFFSAAERHDLFSLPPNEQRAAFFRCWTRKEAYLKGTGTGFRQASDLFDVTLLPGVPPALSAHRGDPAEPGRWRLADLAPPVGHCAAAAVAGEIGTISYLTYFQ